MQKGLGKNILNGYMYMVKNNWILFYIPANKYITPVISIALICLWHTPNAPTKAALPNIIKQTSEQDIDKFCIPEIQ